jgi:transposase
MSKSKTRISDWKEQRCSHAVELKHQGWRQTEIAIALKVSKGAVSQWVTQAKRQGKEILCALPHNGRPAELTAEEKRMLPDLLLQGTEAYGLRGSVWTCPRVQKVIEIEFDVSYHRSHVARLLKELHWTAQQPIERATQRNEAKIARWRKEIWLEMKKNARLEHRILVFVDESGFYLLPSAVRTYAPRGKTPILPVFQTHEHLSVMSGVTPQGWLFTLTRYDSLNGSDSIHFLKHLHSQTDHKLLAIWDGSPIHRSVAVRTFLTNGAAKQIHLERLPAYAPDLNPDEGLWNYLKQVELRNLCCFNLDHLHQLLILAILRLRRNPDLIKSFFEEAGLLL